MEAVENATLGDLRRPETQGDCLETGLNDDQRPLSSRLRKRCLYESTPRVQSLARSRDPLSLGQARRRPGCYDDVVTDVRNGRVMSAQEARELTMIERARRETGQIGPGHEHCCRTTPATPQRPRTNGSPGPLDDTCRQLLTIIDGGNSTTSRNADSSSSPMAMSLRWLQQLPREQSGRVGGRREHEHGVLPCHLPFRERKRDVPEVPDVELK